MKINLKKYYIKGQLEAGVDEVGRGCIAGPVVAAAVILPQTFEHHLLNDSKKLTARKRSILEPFIKKNAIAYEIKEVSSDEIDKINILNASILAMNKAVKALDIKPDFLLIDGNRFYNNTLIPHKTIVKGDSIYASIAAASILAKEYRDRLICKLAIKYPYYRWEKNKGYPTKEHIKAIDIKGITPLHRKSFKTIYNRTNNKIL